MSNTQPTQATASPPPLTPGAILASPQGRGTITIVDVYVGVTGRAEVSALVDDHVWIWPRRSTERTLSGMGFVLVGHEDPAVLAERVKLALATYSARRAA